MVMTLVAQQGQCAALLRKPVASNGMRTRSFVASPLRSDLQRRSAGDQEPSSTESRQEPTPQQPPASGPPPAADPNLARGQATAIVTGAISIIFGIAYLALVQFMDMRGDELLPPPPEAYIP